MVRLRNMGEFVVDSFWIRELAMISVSAISQVNNFMKRIPKFNLKQ